MKNKLRLHNNIKRRGASLLIAILVFFLAALSGTVALTMSASNAGRYSHEREDQQAYLYCWSAARLILSRLENLEVEFKSNHQSAPISSKEVTVLLYKRIDETNRVDLSDTNADMLLGDENFKTMLTDYALNVVMKPVEFCLYLDSDKTNKVFVNIQRAGSNFNFDFWVERGGSKDYQMSMSQVLGSFDENEMVGGSTGTGQNFREHDDGYFYRTLKFDVKKAAFTVGNLAAA